LVCRSILLLFLFTCFPKGFIVFDGAAFICVCVCNKALAQKISNHEILDDLSVDCIERSNFSF